MDNAKYINLFLSIATVLICGIQLRRWSLDKDATIKALSSKVSNLALERDSFRVDAQNLGRLNDESRLRNHALQVELRAVKTRLDKAESTIQNVADYSGPGVNTRSAAGMAKDYLAEINT